MSRRTPRLTRPDTLFPDTTLFRSPDGRQLVFRRRADERQQAKLRRHRTHGLAAIPRDDRQIQSLALQPVHRRRGIRPDMIGKADRSEEHTSELQSLMRISYAVFCLKKKKKQINKSNTHTKR